MQRQTIIDTALLVAIGTGLFWIGTLSNRVAQLEKSARELTVGPRGQNCQQIVERLVQKPNDPALKGLAEEWGCSAFAASMAPRDPDSQNTLEEPSGNSEGQALGQPL